MCCGNRAPNTAAEARQRFPLQTHILVFAPVHMGPRLLPCHCSIILKTEDLPRSPRRLLQLLSSHLVSRQLERAQGRGGAVCTFTGTFLTPHGSPGFKTGWEVQLLSGWLCIQKGRWTLGPLGVSPFLPKESCFLHPWGLGCSQAAAAPFRSLPPRQAVSTKRQLPPFPLD